MKKVSSKSLLAGLSLFILGGTFSTAEALSVASVKASSLEKPAMVAERAVDNNMGTRWSSSFKDNQWLEIELDQAVAVEQLDIFWEGAYGKNYEIQTAMESGKWALATEVKDKTAGGKHTIMLDAKPMAKFIRINCLKRGTQYGFSIIEIKLNGQPLTVKK
jgi:hypothetical protein